MKDTGVVSACELVRENKCTNQIRNKNHYEIIPKFSDFTPRAKIARSGLRSSNFLQSRTRDNNTLFYYVRRLYHDAVSLIRDFRKTAKVAQKHIRWQPIDCICCTPAGIVLDEHT